MNSKLLSRLLIPALLLTSHSAMANLVSGSSTNLSGNNISNTNPGTVTVRWSMVSTGSAAPPGAVISSTSGVFTDGASTTIGTNNKILTKTITPVIGAQTVNITETFTIPKSVLFTASRLGLKQITYKRTFTDCPGSVCDTLTPDPSITLNLTPGDASEFSITSYKLRFNNDETNIIVEPGSKLQAYAQVTVTSTSTARGLWEVATSASTLGTPIYKPLRNIQKQLISVSDNRILSPRLPTTISGVHLLRFRFTDPLLAGETPVIRYYVKQQRNTNLPEIDVRAPGSGETVTSNSVFEWLPVPGAKAYKVEFNQVPFLAPKTKPLAGIIVKANEPRTPINQLVSAHLLPDREYWFRITGLGDKGNVIASSSWIKIKR